MSKILFYRKLFLFAFLFPAASVQADDKDSFGIGLNNLVFPDFYVHYRASDLMMFSFNVDTTGYEQEESGIQSTSSTVDLTMDARLYVSRAKVRPYWLFRMRNTFDDSYYEDADVQIWETQNILSLGIGFGFEAKLGEHFLLSSSLLMIGTSQGDGSYSLIGPSSTGVMLSYFW
ncbi:MAG: hypothetical protein OEZ43_01555 [Gammaproteobacteria bacterium]|nr:hypothetical protein [Gammaproteobacteria bacterium]